MRPRFPRESLLRLAAGVALGGLSAAGIGLTTSSATFSRSVDASLGTIATRAACPSGSPFAAAVLATAPTFYYRFAEAAGAATVADSSGNGHTAAVRTSSPDVGVAPPLGLGVSGTGLVWCDDTGLTSPAIPGTLSSGSFVVWPTARPNLDVFTIAAWVRTTSTGGGRIMGMGSSTWAKDVHYDRQLWLDDTGHPVFGVYVGVTVALRGSVPVNDGEPHFLVATVGPDGARLYVDGVLDRTDPVSRAEVYTANEPRDPPPPPGGSGAPTPDGQGYWRVGWDNLANWGAVQPTDFGLDGVVDEAALWESVALSDAEVGELWAANHW